MELAAEIQKAKNIIYPKDLLAKIVVKYGVVLKRNNTKISTTLTK